MGTPTGTEPAPHPSAHDVELLVTAGCHLCREAEAVAGEICAELGVGLRVTDIGEDDALMARFGEEIPVLRIDGAVRDFWRIDPARMRRLLGG